MDNIRAMSLKKAFKGYLDGKRLVNTLHEAQIFFDAVRLQDCPSECLEYIVGSKAGLKAVRQSVRASLDKEYVRQRVLPFLFFFSNDEVKALYDGTFLQQFVKVVIKPPTAWANIVKIYRDDTILHNKIESEMFAWMCYQIVSHPDQSLSDLVEDVVDLLNERPLLELPWEETRTMAYLIKKALDARNGSMTAIDQALGQYGPGGRHDNDFKDFREISIFPTPDELTSKVRPFLRRAYEIAELDPAHRAACHLDNQYRLYRADFLSELKDDISAVLDPKKQQKRCGEILGGLALAQTAMNDLTRIHPYSLNVSFTCGLYFPPKLDEGGRREYLKTKHTILGHQNLGFLFHNKKALAFAFVIRNVEDLIRTRPMITLRFVSVRDFVNGTQGILNNPGICFAVVNSSWFAYEPVLERLKQIREIPLQDELLMLGQSQKVDLKCHRFQPSQYIKDFATICRQKTAQNLEVEIVDRRYTLDAAQAAALMYALENPLSVIQGPPGTGKSFIGALIVKLLLQSESSRILVLTFTNHSVNQMLEDLLDIGVSREFMTRMGSKYKASSKTAEMSFELQLQGSGNRLKHDQKFLLDCLKMDIMDLRVDLHSALEKLGKRISPIDILNFLELDDEGSSYDTWAAFQPPEADNGYKMIGKAGMALHPQAMLQKWQHGQGPGAARAYLSPRSKTVWNLDVSERKKKWEDWCGRVRKEHIEAVKSLVSQIEDLQREIDSIFSSGRKTFASSRRIIGCTTTSAAMNMDLLKAFKPTCILVEEAGEILEPHVLAALCPSTEQLVLIGDHKQLRPKCNTYDLTVEIGDGYDLNRSLFERLIIQGQRHETLQKQHRMAPEISQLVRSLTYPELLDGEKTLDRPVIRGLCSRVVFINHSNPEEGIAQIKDRRDAGSKASKQNAHEAEMVLKVVRYLSQQGYKSSNIVVLTPYLGQLRLLRDMLSKDNDPILNDLDSAELIRAKLITKAAAKLKGANIKLSSIDNYQGEESDIVVASLTRSNNHGDIGFMKAPERLNVLISRARNCLIMIGNMETFAHAKNGQDTWRPFFSQLKAKEWLYDGLPVRCERHPERIATISTPEDFDEKCPDGGCMEDCKATLPCGKHLCKRKCHLLSNHSKVACDELRGFKCEKGHRFKLKCSHRDMKCPKCAEEEEDLRRRAKQDLELEKARMARQERYRKQLQDIKDEVARLQRQDEVEKEEKDERDSLEAHRRQLETLRKKRERSEASKKASANSARQQDQNTADAQGGGDSGTVSTQNSATKVEWDALKRYELANSQELNQLMDMVGLESVKRKFLDIKSQVDVYIQQGVSLADERFGCTLLGNPGTGKTTVARLYGRFLTTMGVLPGDAFEETTGSELANIGVNGCQQMIDKVLTDGGGVIFIDEAYQLSSGNSSGGTAVLDFLLAKVENLRSQIVFILAGYSKQMESFYAHNPGFPSRFPLEMKFEDYTDEELLDILALQVTKKWKGNMKVEGGLHGLYFRIVSRRLGRGREKEGFGNARAVENMISQIGRRQAHRLKSQRHKKEQESSNVSKLSCFQLTKEDIIGPKPSDALLQSKVWQTLQELIGLESVKESVRVLVDTLESNYERELEEMPIIEYNLNRVFLGNPGTGKTTVAKLYGELLAQIGVLSNGEVMLKSPADFVGDVIGASEKITKGILESTVGKVLVIDEAYGFYGGGANGGADIYKTAAVDTIVANVHSTPGDDRCILLLGYCEQMQDMLKNMNPGLSRRFPLSSAFVFEDFDPAQMATIFRFKLKKQGFNVTLNAEEVALQVLERSRSQPNFGNAGEVDILLNEAKARHQKRVSTGNTKRKETLEAVDFDEEYDRGAKTDVAHLFEGVVGCEQIVSMLRGYQSTVRRMTALGMNPKESIPFNFLFRGPPGTGKTTTARKMGKVFYDAGILGSDEVVEISTSDLIGQYVGQTGPKVRSALDRALGKVLFIDEAYRLASGGGSFAQEALDEIVDGCTKERYHRKLIIILAGYENDINRLLTVNPGLSSRFPEVLDFQSLSPSSCIALLDKELTNKKREVESSGVGNKMLVTLFSDSESHDKLVGYFTRACRLQNWASARDVLTLAGSIFSAAVRTSSSRVVNVSAAIVDYEIKTFIEEKECRAKAEMHGIANLFEPGSQVAQPADQCASPAPQTAAFCSVAKANADCQSKGSEKTHDKELEESPNHRDSHAVSSLSSRPVNRDAGVPDEVWDRLQADINENDKREEEYQAKLQAKKLATDEMRRQIVKELMEEEARREKEAKLQEKLKLRGLCPAGFEWIQQTGGLRCAGGSHWISEAALSKI